MVSVCLYRVRPGRRILECQPDADLPHRVEPAADVEQHDAVAEGGVALIDDQVAETVFGVRGGIIRGETLRRQDRLAVVLDALGPAGAGETGRLDALLWAGAVRGRVAEIILGDHVLRMQPR